ncbi:TetR/AcrR family transcriptional regulator, partial [Actinotalea sp. C106]|uniref:TetR/AcrR family transcriptional regulator n=1 Tax=Actinotalea sp. C106 TaxID=2908644 RepID=UPI002027C789
MPRISAPTLVEHRANQRAAVLRAAEELAVERGAAAVTVAAVAARTGIARPSVYAYFASADAILEALVHEGFERWRVALDAGIATTTSPEELVRGYFAAAAASAARGDHRLAGALR